MEGENVIKNNVSYLIARDPSILSFNRPQLAQVRTNLISELNDETSGTDQKLSKFSSYFHNTAIKIRRLEEMAVSFNSETDYCSSPESFGEKDSFLQYVYIPVKDENIRVYLRIKNYYEFENENLYTIQNNTLICRVPQSSSFYRNIKDGDSLQKKYTFTKIFDSRVTQAEIFNDIVKRKILDFINGQNSTLLTYGASGSGKTFTVIGTDEEPGIVPRSLEYLFRTLPKLSSSPSAKPSPTGDITLLTKSDCQREKQLCKSLLNASSSSIDRAQHVKTYTTMQQRLSNEPVGLVEQSAHVSLSIWVSFTEIYNEQIYDLLKPAPARGKQRTRLQLGSSSGVHYVKNLTCVNVSSGLEAYQILQYGIQNLNYASTNVNAHSSRSHSIFTIKLVQVSELDGGTHVSNFNFCDLAGSERLKKTMNVGDRLKESNNINSSLLVLGRCIAAIRNSQKQNDHRLVPFRESKLTQLFQNALAGYEDIAMIVTISPVYAMFDESQHVLNFSAIAKDIIIDHVVPKKKKNRFSQYMENRSNARDNQNANDMEDTVELLRKAVVDLYEELEIQRNEYETNEKLNRDHIIQGYEKILKENEEYAEQRIEEARRTAELDFEMKLFTIKSRYEKILKEKENEVIEIYSSDDEEPQQLKEMVMDQQRQIASLQNNLTQNKISQKSSEILIQDLREENLKLKEENSKLKEENLKLIVENLEQKKTLDDAVYDYLELEKKYNEETKTRYEKCNELENELDCYQQRYAVVSNEIHPQSGEEDNEKDEHPIQKNYSQEDFINGCEMNLWQ